MDKPPGKCIDKVVWLDGREMSAMLSFLFFSSVFGRVYCLVLDIGSLGRPSGLSIRPWISFLIVRSLLLFDDSMYFAGVLLWAIHVFFFSCMWSGCSQLLETCKSSGVLTESNVKGQRVGLPRRVSRRIKPHIWSGVKKHVKPRRCSSHSPKDRQLSI